MREECARCWSRWSNESPGQKSTKHQAPEKLQAPNSKLQSHLRARRNWGLELDVSLELGAWDLELAPVNTSNMGAESLIWVLLAACLAVSFLLSGMEAGVFALSRLRVRQQMRAGRRSARVLHDFLDHPENFLWTILVGNTVANFF